MSAMRENEIEAASGNGRSESASSKVQQVAIATIPCCNLLTQLSLKNTESSWEPRAEPIQRQLAECLVLQSTL
jgi:hypothetical protein